MILDISPRAQEFNIHNDSLYLIGYLATCVRINLLVRAHQKKGNTDQRPDPIPYHFQPSPLLHVPIKLLCFPVQLRGQFN
jgi:hypothetical protein